MNAQQDEIDLREYLRSGSREALGSIARRHLNFVYGVARREMGDEHQAEDVTQAVFIVLSRCAAKVKPASLPGWLFVTTRNVAANARKAALRRQFHERKAAEVKSEHVMNSTHEQDQIAHIGHHLHEALAAVRESDRSIVIMRHVHGLEIAEISGALGLSDDATRKRLERAMEKLRRFLSGRGVTVGAAALCATLAGVAEAAPQTLSTTVVGGTASGGAAMALAKSTTAAMTWTQMKAVAAMLLVASILTLSITGIWVTLSRHGVTTIATAATAQVSAPATAPSIAPSPTAATLTYTGLVTDPDGKPVAGARVFSFLESIDPTRSKDVEGETTTDADGKYTLSGLTTIPIAGYMGQTDFGQRTIVFDKPDFALAWRGSYGDDRTVVARGGTIDAPVMLQKPTSIAIHVVDANSQPVAGADVTLWLQDISGITSNANRNSYGYLLVPVSPAKLTTDAQGMATFDRVPATARAHVQVSHPNYVQFSTRDGYRGDTHPVRSDGGALLVTLQPGGTLRVHLPMRDGKPLLNAAQLSASAETGAGQNRSDHAVFGPDGIYLMAGLHPGTYSLTTSPFSAGQASLGNLLLPQVKEITVSAGEITDVAIESVAGHLITGRLVDPRTKLPVADIPVNSTTSGADGRFAFYALSGPLTLLYYTYTTRSLVPTRKQITVAAEGPTALDDIESIPQPMIRGRLVDTLGKAVAGGRVMDQFGTDVVLSDGDGSFALPMRTVPSGQATFIFAFNNEGVLSKATVADDQFTDPKLALPGAALPTIKLAGTVMITGSVVDSDGKPVNDADVTLDVAVPKSTMSIGFSRPPWGGMTHDGNRFTFNNVPVGLEIQVMIHRDNTDAQGVLDNLNPGELRDLGELVLTPRPAMAVGRRGGAAPPADPGKFNFTLTGVVVDDETDKPMMGVRVDGIPQPRIVYRSPIDYTDQDGRFYLKGLPDNSKLTLVIDSSGYERISQTVDAGSNEIKVRLKVAGSNLIGKPAPQWNIAEWVNSPPMQLNDLHGKVVLLWMGLNVNNNFTGTYDYVAISDALKNYGPRGLVAVGMYGNPAQYGRSDSALQQIADYVKTAQIPFPIAIDSPPDAGKTHKSYASENQWRMVLIDKQGILRAFPRRENLSEWIEKLLAE